MSESRPPDDTPRCYNCGKAATHDAGYQGRRWCDTCVTRWRFDLSGHMVWAPPPVAPDDTPTRLSPQDEADTLLRALKHQELLDTPVAAAIGHFIEQLRAGRADVSRLQQEHALLRRSLDILVKQMADAGV